MYTVRLHVLLENSVVLHRMFSSVSHERSLTPPSYCTLDVTCATGDVEWKSFELTEINVQEQTLDTHVDVRTDESYLSVMELVKLKLQVFGRVLLRFASMTTESLRMTNATENVADERFPFTKLGIDEDTTFTSLSPSRNLDGDNVTVSLKDSSLTLFKGRSLHCPKALRMTCAPANSIDKGIPSTEFYINEPGLLFEPNVGQFVNGDSVTVSELKATFDFFNVHQSIVFCRTSCKPKTSAVSG